MKHIPVQWRQKSRLFATGLVVLFGTSAYPLARAGGVDFKQAANRNPVPGNVIWITSILQLNNSRYFEGLSTLQRLVVFDIPAAPDDNPNRHSLKFSHEAAKSGFHAYDFLTSWEQARAASICYSGSDLFDPLNPDGENLSSSATGVIIRQLRGGTNRFAATAPNGLGIVENDDVQARANVYALKFGERVIQLYGDAPILSAELRFDGYSGSTDKFAEYTLVWESSSTNLLIEMAGHLAIGGAADNPLGYGPSRGSASINGGPYHFKLSTLDGASLGSQDNQIKGADIQMPPPVVALNSSLQNICAGSAPATFTATVIADGTAPFSYAWIGPDGFTSNAATIFVSVAGTYTVVVTDASGLTSPAVSAVLTVSPRPIVTITSGQITCSKPEVDLVAESSASGLSFHWSGPGIVSGGEQRIVTVNQRGEYTLVVVDSNGCSTTVSVVVDENKRPPDATAEGGTLACATPQISLRASSATAGALFRWNGPGLVTGTDTATPTVNLAGTYQVTVTDPVNGCSAIATAVVNENKTLPVVTASGGVLTCLHPELRLSSSSSVPGTKFAWSGPGIVSGADTASPLANKPGEYMVTAQDPVNGCSATAAVTVSENLTAPVVNVTGATLTCAKREMPLHASCTTPAATFRWNGPGIVSGAETDSPLVNSAGVYAVTATDPANGCATTAFVTVTEDRQPPDARAEGGTLACATPQISLRASSATAGALFHWNGPGLVTGADTATPTVNLAGTYLVTVTDPVNGCSAIATAIVNENKALPVVTTSGGVLTCLHPELRLSSSSSVLGTRFAWSGPGIVSGADTASPLVNKPGEYIVTAQDPVNGCSATTAVTVSENLTAPVVNVTGATLTCATPQISLRASSATAGALFRWSGPGLVTGADTATPTVNLAGTYQVTVTDPLNGCSAIATAIVNENKTLPVVTASGGVLTCLHPELRLSSSSSAPGTRFAWSGPGIVSGADTASPLVNKPGEYMVTAQDPVNGCSSTAAVTVSENLTAPVVNATGATLTCAKREMALHASCATPAATFRWNGPGIVSGAETDSPLVNSAGVYSVTATDPANGCATTAFVTVTEDRQPPDATAEGGTLACATPQISLSAFSAAAGALFHWNGPGLVTGADTATPTVNLAGTYQVTVTDPLNGCSAIATAIVNENKTLPVVTASGGVLTCLHPELRLSSSSSVLGTRFAWSGPGIVSGADTASPLVNKPGEYMVTAQDPVNGCSAAAAVTVSENLTAPVVNAAGATLTCAKREMPLHASCATPAATFRWSGPGIVSGAETDSPLVNSAGVYSVTATDPANGCATTAFVTVDENKPALDATAEGGTLTCATSQINLRASSATAGALFHWNGPGLVTGADTATPTVNLAGTYQVTITDPVNGCSAIATAVVNENKTLPVVTASGGVLTCLHPELRLSSSSSVPGTKFAWSGPGIVSGADTASPLVNKPGEYIVTAQDPVNGCSATAAATVSENLTAPVVNVTGATLTCAKREMPLHASCATPAATFRWNGPGIVSGAETDSPLVNSAGVYAVTATDPANGCATTASVTVTEDRQPPVVSVSGATLTCAEPMATLRALSSSPDSTFVWTGPGIVSGNDTATPSVNQPGDYSVVVTDQRNGCSATASAVVSENKTGLTLTATGGMLTCAHPELVLRAMSDSSDLAFLWLGPGIVEGANTASPTVNKPGDYTVTARNPVTGCSTILHVLVTENKPTPVIATAGGTLTCAQPQLILNASSPTAGATFSWTGPGLVSGAGTSQPTVDAPGTYVVTVTDPTTECSSTATAVVLENKTQPTITAEGGALTCAQQVLTLHASSPIANATFLWTGPGILAGGNSASPTVSQPGVYTVIVTDPVNGCSASTSATVTQDTAMPVVITHGAVLTCSQTQVVISATATKPGMTCSWSGPGIISGADSPDCVVNARGLYSVTVTDPAMGCSTTASVSVTEEKNPPVAVITAPNSVEPNSTTNLLRATCSAGTLAWTASGSGWTICGSADTNQATFSAGSAGSSGTFTLEVKSPGGCTATYQVTVSARAADGAALVSMSQGFYGNSGGTLNGIKSPELVRRLLTNSQSSGPLPLVVGKVGVRSLTIPLESAQSITTRLPAGGAASALPDFKDQILKANNGQTSPPLPVSNGKFANILLGQTVTLSLNSRLSPRLLAFPLSNTFVTQKALPGPDNAVGTADDIRSVGMATFTIPTTVLTALNRLALETTVAGLLELANQGLAGKALGGATLKDVNAAVDAINRGFDKGRFPVNKPVIVADTVPQSSSVAERTSAVSAPEIAQSPQSLSAPSDQIAGSGNDVPVLAIARGASGTLLITWPAARSNYVLQASSSLSSPDWLEVTTPAVVVENICVVTNTMDNGMQFFRLKKP